MTVSFGGGGVWVVVHHQSRYFAKWAILVSPVGMGGGGG